MTRVEVILASTSPRRRMLLRMLGIHPTCIDPGAVERDPAMGDEPAEYVLRQALAKLEAVVGEAEPGLVLAADTIVVLEGRVFGKPVDAGHARRMLRVLAGRTHEVLTAVAVAWLGSRRTGVERTRVELRQLEDEEIDRYVAGGEPLDKAGAYAIQGRGAALVRGVNGCFFNVVGLPLALLFDLLGELGIRYDVGSGQLRETAASASGGAPGGAPEQCSPLLDR